MRQNKLKIGKQKFSKRYADKIMVIIKKHCNKPNKPEIYKGYWDFLNDEQA